MCGTTKFIGRVNTGEKFYCNACMKKINDSGMDYWKSCTQVEFLDSMVSHMKNREPSTENWSGLKKQLQEIKEEEKMDDENFEHVSKYFDENYYNEE